MRKTMKSGNKMSLTFIACYLLSQKGVGTGTYPPEKLMLFSFYPVNTLR
jgi:hypothetical protein